jgi:hypothetical protein
LKGGCNQAPRRLIKAGHTCQIVRIARENRADNASISEDYLIFRD